MKSEQLLRIRSGEYASPDGRFYATRERRAWRVIDASRPKSLETTVNTLSEARKWMRRRRKVRP